MKAHTMERLAFAALFAGLISLYASAGAVVMPTESTLPTSPDAVRSRLKTAQTLRAEKLADDRFDEVIEEVSAGVGFGTPSEIVPMLRTIEIARALERAEKARTPQSDQVIASSLSQSFEALDRARASASWTPGLLSPARRATATTLAGASLALTTCGAIGLLVAVRRRRRIETAVANRLGLPRESGLHGTLSAEVNLYALSVSASVPQLPAERPDSAAARAVLRETLGPPAEEIASPPPAARRAGRYMTGHKPLSALIDESDSEPRA